MDNLAKGMGAGFFASAVLALLLIGQRSLGIVPALDAIGMQSKVFYDVLGTPATIAAGWIAHFLIGTVLWGGIFGAYNHAIPGESEVGRGFWFGLVVWLLSMLVFMPVAGVGVFASTLGIGVAFMSLLLHVIFGIVMGIVYASMLHISATRPVSSMRINI